MVLVDTNPKANPPRLGVLLLDNDMVRRGSTTYRKRSSVSILNT